MLRNRKFRVVVFTIVCVFMLAVFNHHQTQIRKVAFMKVHKTGSTVITNLLFRFTYQNQLNMVVPKEGNYLSKTELFHRKSLDATPWRNISFDIFALHNRWNKKEVLHLLGQETVAFTIVRDPVDVFESLFNYCQCFYKVYGVKTISELVELIRKEPGSKRLNKRAYGFLGRNQMAWDLGLPPAIYDDPLAVEQAIRELDGQFDLVMDNARMDESLILLKDLLHWPIENVVHLDLNRRKAKHVIKLPDSDRQVLYQWLNADVQIYQHFSRKLEETIARLDRNYMEEQVDQLKEANRRLYDRCVIQEKGNDQLKGIFQGYVKPQLDSKSTRTRKIATCMAGATNPSSNS